MKCSACGREAAEVGKFCTFCGNALINDEPEAVISYELSQENALSKKAKNKTAPIIISAVIVLALIAVAFFFVRPKVNYNNALKAMQEERWADARELLAKYDYDDSASLTEECLMHEYADYEFLRTLEKSLTQRLDAPDDADTYTLIDNELSLLESFSGAEFHNPEVEELALQYIAGAKKQKDSLGELEDQSGHYLSNLIGFDEGLILRYGAAKTLVEEYGLFANEPERAEYCLDHYERAEAEYEIDQDMTNQLIGEIDIEYDEQTELYYIKYENRTEYEFDFDLYSIYSYKDQFENDEMNIKGLQPGEIVALNLEVMTKLSNDNEKVEAWNIQWEVGDIFKDGLQLKR